MNKEEINEIRDGLIEIKDYLKEKVEISNELNINMKQNLESLQSSLMEIKKYIDVLSENIEDDNNIFYVGAGNQENKNKLKEQNKIKSEIEERIKEIEESIKAEEDRKKFLLNIADSLHIYINKLNSFNEKNNYIESKKTELLKNLYLCQKFSKIDHERCYIELSKVIEEVEKWEES